MFCYPKTFENTVQWAIGLEPVLLVKNPQKVMFTFDSPNGGSLVNYPEAFTHLMYAKRREDVFLAFKITFHIVVLPGIDRELNFYEPAIRQRAPIKDAQQAQEDFKASSDADSQYTIPSFRTY